MKEIVLLLMMNVLFGLELFLLGRFFLKKESVCIFIKKRQWLHPNAICLERVFIAWVSIIFFLTGLQYIGISLYIFAAYLDAVDGMVARSCNLVTEEGKKLDPLCDKLAYLPPLLFFATVTKVLPLNIVVILIVVELLGQYLVRYIVSKLGWDVAANNFGKIKAVLLFSLPVYLFLLQQISGLVDFSNQLLVVCLGLSLSSAIFKLIPNKFYADILSVLNLVSGLIGIHLIAQNNLIGATLAVMVGQIFDLFDGRAAEKHGGTKVGPWLDDLADFVSFGICPMMFILVVAKNDLFGQIMAGAYLMAIVYRLVRFVLKDKKQSDYNPAIFCGLPSPAGAMIIFGACLLQLSATFIWLVVGAVVALSVSTIPFVHFGRGIVEKMPRLIIVLFGAVMAVLLVYFFKIHSQQGIGFSLLLGMGMYFILSESTKKNYF